ncbi:hypothetical protein H920_16231 [Fukomys damarensis]|uniref:Uncharacterized protein n=1 Tax=Fukomys damarensis TaxID=885580 RepID=A0A091CV47_FUKDA|nr:hypothetical protein H920_16231 [Fukomys damarensis]
MALIFHEAPQAVPTVILRLFVMEQDAAAGLRRGYTKVVTTLPRERFNLTTFKIWFSNLFPTYTIALGWLSALTPDPGTRIVKGSAFSMRHSKNALGVLQFHSSEMTASSRFMTIIRLGIFVVENNCSSVLSTTFAFITLTPKEVSTGLGTRWELSKTVVTAVTPLPPKPTEKAVLLRKAEGRSCSERALTGVGCGGFVSGTHALPPSAAVVTSGLPENETEADAEERDL